ncbi:FMN-linked oxidoreductase [Daldinia grandis]|nr:FMN-linked oxidoreductase [Daldinia grandis]
MSQPLELATLGDSIQLRNGVCMGVMIRNRCIDENKPTSASDKDYANRAQNGAGLTVAEGIFVYYNGAEWPHTPVMLNDNHAAAWKKSLMLSMMYTARYFSSYGIPGHTTNITEIEDPKFIAEQYRNSAMLAKLTGFNGIELLDQGRSKNCTGLIQLRLAFINISRRGCYFKQGYNIHSRLEGFQLPDDWEPLQQFGRLVKYTGSETILMVNHEYTVEEAETLLDKGKIDLITFSRPFFYNLIAEKKPIAVNDSGGYVNYGPSRMVDEFYNNWS